MTDQYGAKLGIDLTPDQEVDNLSMAMSLVTSTGGVALMPLYARNLLPTTVVSRPLSGAPAMIDLSLGYNQSNTSPLLKKIISRIEYPADTSELTSKTDRIARAQGGDRPCAIGGCRSRNSRESGPTAAAQRGSAD